MTSCSNGIDAFIYGVKKKLTNDVVTNSIRKDIIGAGIDAVVNNVYKENGDVFIVLKINKH